ncbi:MAG: methyl-accepting chemotaxis protein, partial [Rubrobacteridae bacterium]|nr:methyl-accepting chemotaxis protein [Rubrobacteridae bacterium]
MIAAMAIVAICTAAIYPSLSKIAGLNKMNAGLQEETALFRAINDFNADATAAKVKLYEFTIYDRSDDLTAFKKYIVSAEKDISEIKKLTAAAKSDVQTDIKRNANLAFASWAQFKNAANAVANGYNDKNYKYRAKPNATLYASGNSLNTHLETLLDQSRNNIVKSSRQSDQVGKSIFSEISKLFGAAFLSMVLVILFLYVGIYRRLKALIAHFRGASKKLSATSDDLAANSNIVAQTTSQITSAITQVAYGSNEQSKEANDAQKMIEQIASAVDQVAKSAQAQVASVDEMARGMSQLEDSIKQVSDSANVVSSVAGEASDVASKGKAEVENTIEGMHRIKSSVLDTAYKIETLGEKSSQIGEIIEVINDIAEQTNLLALNAAIEAARAGEHGKGFAVVADEVRKLAERSARATGEIADLIKSIQEETMDAVQTMEK